MRQVGYLAAAARYAIHNNRERLKEDHRRTTMLAEGLRGLAPGRCETFYPENGTNLLYFKFDGVSGDALQKTFSDNNVHMMHLGKDWLRAVIHLHIDDEAIERTLQAAGKMLKTT